MLDFNAMPYPNRSAQGLPPVGIAEEGTLRHPRVVALGGGTGLPVVLRSLKKSLYPGPFNNFVGVEPNGKELTAIVTVTDDGGSSGRLRSDFNILPPGDIRNCLSALSDNSVLSTDVLQYRFKKGNGLIGHNMGNLLLAALTDLKGDFLDAVECCGRMMNVQGSILPSTPTNVSLSAMFTDGTIVRGESAIVKYRGRIRRVFLHPSHPDTHPSAIRAIERADAIVIGPGSLFTSIIPNLLVENIFSAIKKSRAKKIYICNLMTEPGETEGYTVCDHINAVFDHTEYGLFQYVIVNKGRIPDDLRNRYACQGVQPVRLDRKEMGQLDVTAVLADVISVEGGRIRHDEGKLGRLLMELV